MLRQSLTLLALAAAATFVACDEDDDQQPTPPLTTTAAVPSATTTPSLPTPGPMNFDNIGVRPPLPAADALSQESFNSLMYIFVLDLASRLVQPVDINDESSEYGMRVSRDNPITWLDDDTLWLGHPSSPVELDLDGAVRAVGDSPPSPTPRAGASVSGEWGAMQLASGNGGATFQSPPFGETLYRVANAQIGAWSPTRDVHALSGSSCSEWDLFLFDPFGGGGEKPGTLTNLTANDDRRYWDFGGYVWAPDGTRIAAGAMNALVIIDTATGGLNDVALAADTLALRVLEWSPSSRRLLFQLTFPPQVDCPNRGEDAYLDPVPDLGGP